MGTMLCKLAFKNIAKSMRDYAIYFLTLVFGVAIFYMFNSLDSQTVTDALVSDASNILEVLSSALIVVSVFVAMIFCFLIVYANRFLIKRRKQEFALYQMLGMGKLRISMLLVFETLLIGIVSLGFGLLLGIILSQLFSLIVVSMFEADMSNFLFTFSPFALGITIICFSFMYGCVMLFHTVTITRSSLAKLLRAQFQNEEINHRPLMLYLGVLIMGSWMLIYAYYRVTHGMDVFVSPSLLGWMILMGIFATILIIYALSGGVFRLLQKWKRFYFHRLNSFILREIYAQIHSTVLTMSIICILLFFTICIFTSAFSVNLSTTKNLQENLPCDLTITKTMELPDDGTYDQGQIERSRLSILDQLTANGFDVTSHFSSTLEVGFYIPSNEQGMIRIADTMNEQTRRWVEEQYPTIQLQSYEMFMKCSDYNALATLFGCTPVELDEDEYAIVADTDVWITLRSLAMQNDSTIEINGHVLKPASSTCTYGHVEMSASRTGNGIIIVSDDLLERKQLQYHRLFADYRSADTISKQEAEQTLIAFLEELGIAWNSSGIATGSLPDTYSLTTKIEIQTNVWTLSLMVVFIGLYIGIVFLISSAVVLALKQLASISDGRARYEVLYQLGVRKDELCHILFVQHLFFFGLPLCLALIHSIFGLKVCSTILSMMGEKIMIDGVLFSIFLLMGIYGVYFIVTYISSRNMIREIS